MNSLRVLSRFSLPLGIICLLLSATAALAMPASPSPSTAAANAPEAVGVTVTETDVWNGHSCAASVPVNVTGLTTGLGGYEARLTWNSALLTVSSSPTQTLDVGTFLTNGGTRKQAGAAASGTSALLAAGSGTLKFGNFSWDDDGDATTDPGPTGNGLLAMVKFSPTATCGSTSMTLSETQLVDINGAIIPVDTQTSSKVNVWSIYDVQKGNGPLVNTGDVNEVRSKLNQATGATTCGANYRYDVQVANGPLVNTGDVNAVRAKLNRSTGTVCLTTP
jgi:hypothetical protein